MKYLFKILFGIVLLLPCQLKAQNSIADAIKQNSNKLHYPRSVERFYQQQGFRLIWVLKDTVKTPVWDAMIILDCVLQYGLDPADYHSSEITYDHLHYVQSKKANDSDKARFDILLTDAMITLINNLHYGKYNPYFTAINVDADNKTLFRADYRLENALEQTDVMTSILNVQPHSEVYINLQRHLKLLITKYNGITRVKPENDIRQISVNMEWLRWINTTGKRIQLTCIVKDGVIIYNKPFNKKSQGFIIKGFPKRYMNRLSSELN